MIFVTTAGKVGSAPARLIALADGDCDYVTDDVPQILGRPAGSFERFAVDYAAAFSRSHGRRTDAAGEPHGATFRVRVVPHTQPAQKGSKR